MKVLLATLTYASTIENNEVIAGNYLNVGNFVTTFTDNNIKVDIIEINVKGLSKALNIGLNYCILNGYDGVCFMANDIVEPKDWLMKRIESSIKYEHNAIIAIPVNERVIVDYNCNIIGNYYIPKKIIESVGYFTDSFGVYGAIDLDYCQRARVKGFQTLYLGGIDAKHLTINSDTKYGFSKKEQVDKTWDMHVKDVQEYCQGKGQLYQEPPEYIINMQQYFNESGNRIRDIENDL